MADNTLFKSLEQSGNLPQLPQVMLRLIKACEKEKTSIDELADIISTDPALSSKLIQIISSPYINLPKEVNSIKTAVVYLGIDTIRNIAISTSAMRFFNTSHPVSGFQVEPFWYHSYKCAVVARKLAEEERLADPDEYFLAGLLHDIGRLVLLQTFPDAYEKIFDGAREEKQILEREMDAFGATTPHVSAWLFDQWNLNPLLADAVLYINEDLYLVNGALAHVKRVYIANILSGTDGLSRIDELSSLTDIPGFRLEEIAQEAEDDVVEMANSMGIKLDGSTSEETEEGLKAEIKDLSLFFGTMRSLLQAKDIDGILETARKGLNIIFNVQRVFFFLLEDEKNMLTGFCHPSDKSHKIIRSIALPMSNTASLLVKCVREQAAQCTCLPRNNAPTPAISDTQILRLLRSDALYCVPVHSSETPFGVMVLGVDEKTAQTLFDNEGLVRLFGQQTGVCIQSIRYHSEFAHNIHEKKMEAYATLTDKMVHEINNPIAIVKNYIETLRLKLPDKHPVQDDLAVVGEEMNRMAALLDNLRRFSKPVIGGFEPVDINQLCRRILELLKKSILVSRGVLVSISIDPDIPKIRTDQNGIKQVLINLIKNAAEAMASGGEISLTTRFLSESAKIMIDEKKKIPGSIEIVIADNGPGIDDSVKDTLFEPYCTTKKEGANSGLGLAIVHSIIRDLNGTIRCESKKGEGTRFIITLPVRSSRK